MADLNDVALFARVVQAGSFSAAGRALGIPKATVSRKIARLEADLGARLLHRTTRKLELTEQGRAYYEEAVRGLKHLDAARELAEAAQTQPRGVLRVTAPVGFGTRYLARWIPEFLAACPEVGIELMLTDDRVDLVRERIDVALRTGRLADSSLIARKLADTRRILVASPSYLRRRRLPRTLADLEEHAFVVFGQALSNAVWRLDGPRGPREVAVSGRLAVNDAEAARTAVLAGLGIGLLPFGVVHDDLKNGRLQQILARYGVNGGGLYALYPSARHMSAAVRGFLDFVSVKAAGLPGQGAGRLPAFTSGQATGPKSRRSARRFQAG